MSKITKLLLIELDKSKAPITNRKTACVIETEDGKLYSAHNLEIKEGHRGEFIHAEPQALNLKKLAGDNSKIKTIYLVGRDQEKIKHIAPCSKCFHLLKPFCLANAKIVLYQSDSFNGSLTLGLQEVTPFYSTLEHSELKETELGNIVEELKTKTLLQGSDLIFVANLRLFGLKEKIEFFLTGSLSGRGSISTLINKKLKRKSGDIDVVAVTKSNKAMTERKISNFINEFYKINKKTRWKHWYYMLKAYRTPIYYFDNTGRKVVDLSVSNDLKSGMYIMDFYDNNWYHKLS